MSKILKMVTNKDGMVKMEFVTEKKYKEEINNTPFWNPEKKEYASFADIAPEYFGEKNPVKLLKRGSMCTDNATYQLVEDDFLISDQMKL